jgi:hypothetical protein
MSKLPIECGNGWLDIINACHNKLLEIDPNYKPVQIKEKFGGLRYYYQSSGGDDRLERDDKMMVIVSYYEKKSLSICEMCGEPGTTDRIHGWIKTLCEIHFKERNGA